MINYNDPVIKAATEKSRHSEEDFISGALWQRERYYSPAFVEQLLNMAKSYGATASLTNWFEENKKQ